MAAQLLRWTTRALVAGATAGSSLVSAPAAAAPAPAEAAGDVVVTGAASVALLLVLAGALLALGPRLLRLVRSRAESPR